MKRFIIVLLIMFSLFNLLACGKENFEKKEYESCAANENESYVTLENGEKIKKWDFDKLDDIAVYLCKSSTYSGIEIVEKEYIEEQNKYWVKCKTVENLYIIITIDLDKLYNEGILNVDIQEIN